MGSQTYGFNDTDKKSADSWMMSCQSQSSLLLGWNFSFCELFSPSRLSGELRFFGLVDLEKKFIYAKHIKAKSTHKSMMLISAFKFTAVTLKLSSSAVHQFLDKRGGEKTSWKVGVCSLIVEERTRGEKKGRSRRRPWWKPFLSCVYMCMKSFLYGTKLCFCINDFIVLFGARGPSRGRRRMEAGKIREPRRKPIWVRRKVTSSAEFLKA
jgi:hypothetical protein